MHTTSTNASIGGENGEIINGYAYDFTIPGYTMVDAQVRCQLCRREISSHGLGQEYNQ